MSIDDRLDLFKAEWISDPEQLKTVARTSRYNDLFTAEIAAWCAEVHEHLRDLESMVGVELILMGGNAASLRFDAIKQRGSRDNDYLTVASHEDIQGLMDAFADRFAALHPLFLPSVYEPIRPTHELNMMTYVIPVALRLDHGRASNNTVKVEFHFETDLPPVETLTGRMGPTQRPVLARVPELPYQFVLKLMTLAAAPVGIDEDRRADAVPRQLYDLDLMLATFTDETQWQTMVGYCTTRYARECAHWNVQVAPGEPSASVQQRLASWADCTDPSGQRWRTIRAVQQSQLRRAVHREPWGWRARCLRLATAAQCIELEDGWTIWQQALATAAIVPATKARHFRAALSDLGGTAPKSLPLELHEFVWDALNAGDGPIETRIATARAVLSAV